jgi:hypothetical protein
MAFRVKDLIVNILPPGEGDADGLVVFGPVIFCGGAISHHNEKTNRCCRPHSRKPQVIVGIDELDLTRGQLAELKKQLNQALKEIEAQEKSARDTLEPQTLSEVKKLQTKLQAALADLKRRRSALEG